MKEELFKKYVFFKYIFLTASKTILLNIYVSNLEKKLDLEDGSDWEIGPSMIQDWEDIMVVG